MNPFKKLQNRLKTKTPIGSGFFSEKLKLKSSGRNQNARIFLYTDGLQLSAAIITREGDKLNIHAVTKPSEISKDYLSNILTELSTQVNKLPNRVMMLHSHIALGLLDLPIAENKQLSEDKKANIVRWEMESLYGEQSPHLNIGNVLVQAGAITDLERDSIVKIQEENTKNGAYSGGKLPRFGELAISQGILEPQVLEKYLALQNETYQDDTMVQCGWYQSTQEASVFCAAMNASEHSGWIKQFEEQNLQIDRFYPVLGSISALISSESVYAVIELQIGNLAFSVWDHGVIQSIENVNIMERSVILDDLLNSIEQHNNAFKSIYMWGNHPRTEALFEQLKENLEIPLFFLQWPAEKLVESKEIRGENFLYPLLGIAQDYFFQKQNNGRIPYVLGMPPPPRFYQQRKWQVATGVLCTIFLMVATNNYFQTQVHQAQTDIAKLKKNYKTLKKNNKKLRRENGIYTKSDAEFKELKKSFFALQIQKKAVEVNLIERQKFMRELLPLLIQSVEKDVVLDSFNEDNWYQFRLTGWGLNLAAVSRFERALARHLGRFNMIISKSPSRLLKKGELAGAYRFDFQLARKQKVVK